MTGRAMASPAELNRPSTRSSSQPSNEDASGNLSPQQDTEEYVLTRSHGLVYRRRRGVRTMASLKRDLKGLFPIWLRRRNEAIQNRKKNKVSLCDLGLQFSPGRVGVLIM